LTGSPPPEAGPELHRLLIESVADYAIYALDPAGIVLNWNVGAERSKGYTAAEIVGRSFTVFFPPDAVAAGRPAELLAAAARDGRVEDEGWRVRKDGTRFWANVVVTALREPGGRLVGFAKVTRDLTARRHAEAQARQLAVEAAARAEAEAQRAELEAQTEEAQTLAEELEQANAQLDAAARHSSGVLAIIDDP
jgi:PAS domain S-box-containing protein